MTTIAIVDDEPNILNALKRTLRRQGWNIVTYSDPLLALNELTELHFELIISDFRMPSMNGVELLLKLKKFRPDAIRIVLSGQSDMKAVLDAINKAEVYRFILKPWNDDELVMTLVNALKYADLLQENKQLAETVRLQRSKLEKQIAELKRLEKESPGITRVNFDKEGMIDLSDEYNAED
ncbi:response regulator [Zooshikella marina]|uniref:response regulator n=1 Tax=Zooshikella ganghwensis TaxID=202772 RepID=UPI001BAFE262|nr:response regulator [Zooshikella ganghwensis]MBU2708656.1 response regulator [Zooshikella ganghwensis]